MKTPVITRYTWDPEVAAGFISEGKVVVFPTETVYGVGACALYPRAVELVYAVKQRPHSNPLIVHLAERSDVFIVAEETPPTARLLIEAFFPGPLTLILPRNPAFPKIVSGGLDTVAVRMPALPLAREFMNAVQLPVAAPSANLSGHPSATTWESASEDLIHRVNCILCGPPATIGLESTVVDCTDDLPSLLRPGAVSIEKLRKVIPELSPVPRHVDRSPGMRYHHYAPAAKVQIVGAPEDAAPHNRAGYIGLTSPTATAQFGKCLIPADVKEYSHQLFEFFRECDRKEITVIYCQEVPETELGHALMDRILRASKLTK